MQNEFEIETSDLLGVIKKLESIAKTETLSEIPIILFEGNLAIAANDTCQYRITLSDYSFDNKAFPVVKLSQLVASMPQGRMVNVTDNDNSLELSYKTKLGKKSKSSIATIENKFIPTKFKLSNSTVESKKISDDFKEGIKFCYPFIPKESLRYDLKFLMIDKHKLIACDDQKVVRYKMSEKYEEKFFLSRNQLSLLFNDDFNYMKITEDKLEVFGAKSLALLSFPSEIKFPDIGDSFFKTSNKSITVVKDSFKSALERSILFAEGENELSKKIKLEINKKSLIFDSSNEYGENSEKINLKSSSVELEAAFNPIHVMQIINAIDKQLVKIYFEEFHNGYLMVIKEEKYEIALASYA